MAMGPGMLGGLSTWQQRKDERRTCAVRMRERARELKPEPTTHLLGRDDVPRQECDRLPALQHPSLRTVRHT